MEGQINEIVKEEFFRKSPFIINLRKGELTSEILDDIYKKSNSFKDEITGFEISEEKYNISFDKKKEDNLVIKFYMNKKLVYYFSGFLEQPKNIVIDIKNINIKSIKIFSLQAYNTIKHTFSNNKRYIYIENEESNTIELKTKFFEMPQNVIDIYLNTGNDYKNYDSAIELNGNIEIDPLFLSANFYEIFPEIEKTKNFELILSDKRKNLLKKLKYFIENENNYYWIIGSGGIGTSISLLYFSSFKEYEVIYFNLKLYKKSLKEDKFQEFFYKDIYKLFIKDIDYKEYIDGINFNFLQSIEFVEEKANENSDPSILQFWNYLYCFIKLNLEKNYILIIDQYQSDKYDPQFKGLNKIVNLIWNFNQKNTKIIISSSVNNTDTKFDFIKNLENIYIIEEKQALNYLISEPKYNYNLDEDYQTNSIVEEEENKIQLKESEDLDNKSDCSFCQKIINEEQKKKKKKENDIDEEKAIINSECLLDHRLFKIKRDYFSSLVSGKEIYQKLLAKDEYIVA